MLEETEVAGAQPDRDLVAPSTKAFEDRYGVAVQSDLDELDTLLASSSGRKKLMQVAQQLFCPENVAFFDAYHELAELETAEERVEAAKELIDRFFVPGTPEELNVEHKTRTTMDGVRARLERGLMPDVRARDVFGRAHEEVRGMVAQTVWPQYKTHAAAPPKRRRGGCLSRE